MHRLNSVSFSPSLHAPCSVIGSDKLSKRVRRGSLASLHNIQQSATVTTIPSRSVGAGHSILGCEHSSCPHFWFPGELSSLFTSRGLDCGYGGGWWERRPVLALWPHSLSAFLLSDILFLWICSLLVNSSVSCLFSCQSGSQCPLLKSFRGSLLILKQCEINLTFKLGVRSIT